MNVEIGQYADFYSEWWGLEDGTILALDDERGSKWVKVDGKAMSVEQFNVLEEEFEMLQGEQ